MYQILIIDNGEHLGGGQIIASHIIESVANENIEIGIGSDQNSSLWKFVQDRFAFVKLHHIPVLRLTKGRKKLVDILNMFKHMLYNSNYMARITNQYDLIYINSARSIFLVGFCCIFLKKPFIVHIHLLHKVNELFIIGFFSKLKSCVRVVACSDLVEKSLIPFCGKKVVKINNSLNDLNFQKTANKNIVTSHKIAFFGDLSIEKGFDSFVEIATRLPDIDFIAVGVPSKNILLLSKIIPSNLKIFNSVVNISTTINDLGVTIVIMPSRVNESFGMVAIESVAAGCLVLVSGKGYLNTLANELNLSVCEDVNGYIDCIIKLVELDMCSFFELVDHSRNLVINLYSHEKFRNNILNLFKSISL